MLLFIHSFLHSQILANTECFIIWNTKNRLFSRWHLLLSDIHLRFSESCHRYFRFLSLIILNCPNDYILYIIRTLIFFQIKKKILVTSECILGRIYGIKDFFLFCLIVCQRVGFLNFILRVGYFGKSAKLPSEVTVLSYIPTDSKGVSFATNPYQHAMQYLHHTTRYVVSVQSLYFFIIFFFIRMFSFI